ncbi:MAG: hypothetical protein GQ535_05860 [Rhodobacteraceae bacterium]|nr:hypothetical protein [Paracoccaceae bacterium]
MQLKVYIVILSAFFAGNASADARFSSGSQSQFGTFGLVYAQVQFDQLPQTDMRRMVFYADRATRTLQNLVEGADNRSIYEQDKVNKRFRESITRLADAGARSGLSMDQVADFYTQVVFDNFGQDFMQKVGQLAGGLDFRTLFRNVATVPDISQNDSGGSFIEALAEASQDIQLDVPFSENIQAVVPTEDVVEIAGPVAFPNANAIEVNIVKRIRVVNGRWELVIRAGDSLSTIASAVYGDALSYTTIYSANTDVIVNPNVIEVDTLLVIPKP